MLHGKTTHCPQCGTSIGEWLRVVRTQVRCPHCNVLLEVSITYARVLVLLSLAGGCTLASALSVWRLFFPLLGGCVAVLAFVAAVCVLAIPVCLVLGRVIACFISVPLQVDQDGSSLIKLGLDRR